MKFIVYYISQESIVVDAETEEEAIEKAQETDASEFERSAGDWEAWECDVSTTEEIGT